MRSAAPSSSRRSARRRPRAAGSDTSPTSERRRSALPSGALTTARSDSSGPSTPSTTSASAPTGAEHPASSSARRTRSAVVQARVSASSRAATRDAVPASSARTSTASAPWPGAGSIWIGSISSVTSSTRPSRRSPAAARTTASSRPSATVRSRVSTLPRRSVTTSPRPRASSCARRRGDPVPTVAPAGSSPRVRPSRATSASRASSRVGTAATVVAGFAVVGRSLSECTARSTRPSARAARRADDEHARAAELGQRRRAVRSPAVVTSTSSTS